MRQETFDGLVAEGYNRIPVMREVLADLDTPLSAYLKLAAGPWSYLLESVEGGEQWGRYSIIGLPARTRIEVRGEAVRVIRDDEVIESATAPDPLAWIEQYQARFRVPELPDLPRFTGGLVGYFGYDIVGYIEPRLRNPDKPDPLDCPDILLLLSEEVLVFDNLSGRIYLVAHADVEAGATLEATRGRLDELVQRLRGTVPPRPERASADPSVAEDDFVSGFPRERFEQAVNRIKEYIVEGDVMQVVLSQRLAVPFTAPPIDLYRALRCTNPSPYMYLLDLGEFHVVGSSPEILVRLEDGMVTVRPIAGTRRRGSTQEEDRALEAELLADPKERAEHLMLIDLGRNDVGRVCRIGTVEVTERMVIERYSHVMHIVSNVQGELEPGRTPIDVLRATFPAGTVSGAPKIRAMEIIDELEPVKRGVYAGAVGYISWHGNMDTAIAIRTAVIRDRRLSIQAGAGIVADSRPPLEWEETINKARAIFRAVTMAQQGLE
ncbi:MAG: anthranilate synthase component I [Gammaproteobacteria bacterium]|nr:MAG: anthranilate synthase component I [Gammaproteobacteria bacterium]